MGHTAGKDIFRKVGKKIDNHHVRAPWNESLYLLIKELFSEEEAEVYVKLPYLFSDFERIHKIVKIERTKLERILEQLCCKGLLIDIFVNDKYHYMPSPMVIGIFEFVMMRSDDFNVKECARLFHAYMQEGDFYSTNNAMRLEMSVARSLIHRETIEEDEYTEILNYEVAEELVKQADKIAIGTCSCRHEQFHLETKECDNPLDTCITLGWAADYLIRRNMAKEKNVSETLENLARSKELGLTFCADNVKNRPFFICQCCGCCCNLLGGISRHGCETTVVSSDYLPSVKSDECTGCGLCVKVCPVDAITLVEREDGGKKKVARVDEKFCLGCGVCALKCKKDALKMKEKERRILYPETTFERIILQCIGLGTLQNQIFDNPASLTRGFMRGLIKAFLKLPTSSRTIVSNSLKSRFFRSMFLKVSTAGLKSKGKGWIAEL